MATEILSDVNEIMKNALQGNIDQYDIKIHLNEKGEGFIGDIIFMALTHKGTHEKIEIVVKQEKENNLNRYKEVCRNEVYFYNTIWPLLYKNYKNVSEKNLDFIAKCYGTLDRGRTRIFFVYFFSFGYELHVKTKPFSDDQCRIIFKTYGIYHGLSMALKEKDNAQYKKLSSNLFNFFQNVNVDKFFSKTIGKMKQFFDPYKEKHIIKKLEWYEEIGTNLVKQCSKERFANDIIVHGDCWSNNLMFKYDDNGKLDKIKLLDFQLACSGSPVLDLSYCFYSAGCKETFAKLNEYLTTYHYSLSDTLKEFDLDVEKLYSLQTFKEEWRKLCKHGFRLSLYVWILKLADKNSPPEMTEEGPNWEKCEIDVNKKEHFKERIRELVYHMYDNDFF